MERSLWVYMSQVMRDVFRIDLMKTHVDLIRRKVEALQILFKLNSERMNAFFDCGRQ